MRKRRVEGEEVLFMGSIDSSEEEEEEEEEEEGVSLQVASYRAAVHQGEGEHQNAAI